MVTAIDLNSLKEIIIGEGEDATKFYLGPISYKQKMSLFGCAMDPNGSIDLTKLGEKIADIVQFSLKKITNLKDPKTNEPFNIDKVDDQTMELLPFDILVILFNESIKINFLTQGEAKN